MFCTNCGSQLVDGRCTACAAPGPVPGPTAALGAPVPPPATGYGPDPGYGAGQGSGYGTGQGYGAPPPGYGPSPPGYGAPPPGYGAPPPGYGAGYGAGGTLTTASGEVYPEWLLAKFNWGALGFGWWWALWNTDAQRKWIGVACFLLGFVTGGLSQLGFAIYVGITGNRLAATYRRFNTVADFRATQRAWAVWALVFLCITVALIGLALVLGVLGAILGATSHA